MDRSAPNRFALPGWVTVVTVALLSAVATPLAYAQQGRRGDGLPGHEKVGAADLGEAGEIAAAAGLRYGFTETVLDDGGSQHRLGFQLGAALTPIPALGLSLAVDGQYHSESGGDFSGDGGFLARTRVAARGLHRAGERLGLSGELGLLLPAAESPGDALSGVGAEIDMMLSHGLGEALLLTASAGFRLDRSAEAVPRPDRLSPADRVALEIADANAVPLGLAVDYRAGGMSLFGEWSFEPRVGGRAQGALESPMWLTAGIRLHPLDALQWRASVSVSPSSRPDLASGPELQVVEPRLWLRTGLVFVLSPAPPPAPRGSISGTVIDRGGRPVAGARVATTGEAPQAATTTANGGFRLEGLSTGPHTLRVEGPGLTPSELPVVVRQGENPPFSVVLESAPARLTGQVVRTDGVAVPGARVRIQVGDQVHEAVADAVGRFDLTGMPPGSYDVQVSAEGFRDTSARVELKPGAPVELPLSLERALPDGHIRGHVRNFSGRGVAATVHIEPLDLKLETDADGRFDVDVPPGEYNVAVQARRYQDQSRPAVVEQNGVTVLIIELQRKR